MVRYRSNFEKRLAEGPLRNLGYETVKISYEVRKAATYNPDFILRRGDRVIYIEAKGRFRDRNECNKYLYVRDALKIGEELVFLFMKPSCPMPNSKTRKDGTKQSHAEWAEKNGFKHYNEQTIRSIL